MYKSLILFILISSCSSQERSIFRSFDADEKILATGEVKDNHKFGNWSYQIGECSFDVQWILKKAKDISMTLPKDWDLNFDENPFFYDAYGTFCDDTVEFIISELEPLSFDASIMDCEESIKQMWSQGDSTITFLDKRSKENCSLSRYNSKSKKGNILNILSLAYKTKDKRFFEFRYYFKGGKEDMHHYMFFDLVADLALKNKKLVSFQESIDLIVPIIDSYSLENEIIKTTSTP